MLVVPIWDMQYVIIKYVIKYVIITLLRNKGDDIIRTPFMWMSSFMPVHWYT